MSEPGLSPRVIDYPSSDGKPMTESEAQFLPLTYVALALREHFEQRDDVYVGANMFLYYEENNPRAVVAPDVFVVVGAPKRVRDSYLLWNEPKGPDFVLEVTSRSTRREDQGRKKRVYASLGVGEYFLFDPTGDYLRPRLQGFVLRQGRYERLPTARLPHGEPSLSSEAVGLDLRVRGEELRLYDPDEGYDLYSYSEWAKAHAREKDRAATEETDAESRRGSRRDGGNRAQSRPGPYRRVGGAPTKSTGVTRRQTALWFHRRTERANNRAEHLVSGERGGPNFLRVSRQLCYGHGDRPRLNGTGRTRR